MVRNIISASLLHRSQFTAIIIRSICLASLFWRNNFFLTCISYPVIAFTCLSKSFSVNVVNGYFFAGLAKSSSSMSSMSFSRMIIGRISFPFNECLSFNHVFGAGTIWPGGPGCSCEVLAMVSSVNWMFPAWSQVLTKLFFVLGKSVI